MISVYDLDEEKLHDEFKGVVSGTGKLTSIFKFFIFWS